MPWKESNKVTERTKFIMRHLEGEKVSDLCHEFGISRKTGHKIINRFLKSGFDGLTDLKRTPLRSINKTSEEVERLILFLKREKPTWGAPKIRELFLRRYPFAKCPCKTTVHSLLEKHGLTKSRRAVRRYKPQGTYLSIPQKENDLWSADFKGHFRLGNKRWCYPLTISDNQSRYLFACESLETVSSEENFKVFERVFREYGLPEAIRTDNGVPFSHPQAIGGLTPLSAWWLRLGIKLERIKPGCPQQNGKHERMHKTLKKWIGASESNHLQQQEKFDEFLEEYNNERPHESLEMKTPSERYKNSERVYPVKLEELEYPNALKTQMVNTGGDIRFKDLRIYVGRALAGYNLGITQADDDIYLVNFMDYELGYFDLEKRKVINEDNPFG